MQDRLGNAMVMVSVIASAVITCVIATACSSNGGEFSGTGGPLSAVHGAAMIGGAAPVAFNACDGGDADAGTEQ
jgi:hypothetical protein